MQERDPVARASRAGLVFGYVAAHAGQSTLEVRGRAGFPSFRLKRARARSMLSWTPTYPRFRERLVR
jgi:hypothetical protein